MIIQDVADTSPGTAGPNLFLAPPLTKDEFVARPQPTSSTDKDLMFFMTRSYHALIYSDGGD
jgi:hypothetical protein